MTKPVPNKAPVLEMRAISKTFGSVKALADVSFTVNAGELHALMGENGAGKSTLMKVLSGAYQADPGGKVLMDGAPIQLGDPKLAKEIGISVIYQELSLAPNLTVAQNIFLGCEPASMGITDRRAMNEATAPILKRLAVRFRPDTLVGDLSLGERQLVEIARAMSARARVIVMDEPTTSLSTRETEQLFKVIAGLKEEGVAIIYISHRMEEIYRLSDRCSVLRDGAYVGTLTRAELSAPKLVSMMVGRDLSTFYKKEHKQLERSGETVLSVEGLGDGHFVHDCSFEVRRGEVLGIAGLVGSGRTELARLIFAADPAASGAIRLNGKDIRCRNPREALSKGIAYLTEDRKGLGLFLDMSVSENVSMCVLERDAGRLGIRNFRAAARRAIGAMKSLSIKAPNARINVGALSGGNQQKVLLARLLEVDPEVVILDEPTRGVDVGAKSEIYRLIHDLAARGLAVIMISSELPEIVGVADRVLVMREGTIAGEVAATPDQPIDQERIMALSTGAANDNVIPTDAEETQPERIAND
ncbi:sugar ABC transporter ATP-binding protein [Chelativorans sp. M5D2P16]|uniref:sugar ABC transporter ATP-binding protein n=1 Tax=Chelativorans sp. M5D2P16 TaxID=3095678 RepID=UPI002ACA3279|nr:sugar ABC transporter ATP-binding protein [Chelativorans sp. M5D2P16]MDZ5698571.1 sugar ABC transporter ATP-binding protein [Chelativorans sp. M5D2P16]